MKFSINGITIPDTAMTRDATTFVRDTESDLLFHHSSRVYYWAALAGRRLDLKVDAELLYVGCMFHDVGLTHEHCSCDKRFEVDGANAARDFLQQYGVEQADIDKVWTAIALHTTPGIPQFMAPEIALVTAGVEMDVLGINYDHFSDAEREAVVEQHPRPAQFKEEIIQAFYDGIKNKPDTTFGNVKADVIADKQPGFSPMNFCSVIRQSRWVG
ncbi:phosphohydrolase [Pantoea sp. BL1]|uniref:HD domain-containing protein n=1 Tax=Pantoea sp. BL1 TaxID=1628190 RepID=UPI0005F7F15F|nr:HD domain-containing protein [Pantoea sp. BL1]KJV48918.1 phosphohydrolase [Pantoea sp. BL1]HAU5563435.1 HD domain-containing protein [Serratia fonticola]